MLHLVYGCPGGGKSHFLANLISQRLKENKKVVLIVPERFSVSAEQRVTEICGDMYKMNLDILSFKRLCNRVFREYGGLCYNYAGKGGQILIMYRALCGVRNELQTYKNLGLRDGGTVQAMLDSVVSFKRAALSPKIFEDVGKDCAEDLQLCGKISDVAKIWKEYERLLKEKYDDPEEDLSRLCALLREHRFFADKEVFVDCVTAFTGQELNVLRQAILTSPNVTVTLGFLPKDERPMFQKLRFCRDVLVDAAQSEGIGVDCLAAFERPYKKSEDLAALEKWLYGEFPRQEKQGSHICVRRFENIYEECKAIAARILRDVQAGGRYMDHGVVVRNLDVYKGVIDQVFEANGVPYTMKDRVCLADRGAGRLILAALRLLVGNFRTEDLLDYMKTGFCGLEDAECFLLEDYVNLWRIEGRKRWFSENDFTMNPAGHTAQRTPEDEKKLKEINDVRKKLITPLKLMYEDFLRCSRTEDFAFAVFEYMRRMDLEEALAKKAERTGSERDLREQQFHLQTFKSLCDVLDELVYTMGDVECRIENLQLMLEILFEKKDLGSIPQGKDRVLVSDTFNLSPGRVRILHAAGLNEGIFPAFSRQTGIFTAHETKILRALHVDLPENGERAIYDEEYLCYSVLTLPTETLYASCFQKDLRGNPCKPSDLFDALLEFSNGNRGEGISFAEEDLLFGYANCLEAALQKEGNEKGKALRNYFTKVHKGVLENVKRAPLVVTVDALSEENTAKLYRNGILRLSQSRLESFVGCPFAYTCRYILKLQEKASEDTDANEVGTVVHAVFEKLIGDCIRDGKKFGEMSDGQLTNKVNGILSSEKERILGASEEDVLFRQLFRRIGQSADILAINLRDEFEQSDFKPAFCELSFGMGDKDGALCLPEICTEGENPVALRGTADRVDILKKDGKTYLRVVDYKTGSKEFDPKEIEKGLNLQMLLYLKALKDCSDPRFLRVLELKDGEKIFPAGVLYFIAKSNSVNVDRTLDETQTKCRIDASIKRSGLLIDDPDILRAMEKELNGQYIPCKDGKNGVTGSVVSAETFEELLDRLDETLSNIAGEMKTGRADATPSGKKKDVCTYCPMKPVCRNNGSEDGSDGEGD